MQYFKNICDIILGRRMNCGLCYINLSDDNAVFIRDEITILIDSNVTILVSELVSFLMGADFQRQLPTEAICHQCLKSIIDSYMFIAKCKSNACKLWQVVKNLTDSVECAKYDIDTVKYAFISLNAQNNARHHGNDKNSVIASSKLHRSESYNENNDKTILNEKKDCKLKHRNNESLKNSSVPTNIKTKLRKKFIPLSDILYDDTSTTCCRCKVCFKTFSSLSVLRSHYIRMHVPKHFKCSKCPKTFGSQSLLKRHLDTSHSTCICSQCGKSFATKYYLQVHEFSHQYGISCETCGRIYKTRYSFRSHIKNNICGQNERKSNREAKLECDYCNKRYSLRHTLICHIKTEHGNGKTYPCSWCDKKFSAQSRLKEHIVKHTKEKKFKCDLCVNSFVTKYALLYHTRLHTGEKPFNCDYCDQKFLSKSQKTSHIRRKHNKVTIDCDICKSKFTSTTCLQRHKKRHFNPKSKLHYKNLAVDDNKETMDVIQD